MAAIKTKKTFVTSPSLAPVHEFAELLHGTWESGILTHNGPLIQRLEKELMEYMGVDYLVGVLNGTIALQMAIRALKLKGEIITTPFSWVATCSAIRWEYCQPVFADIDPKTFNLDPNKVEASITENTSAIMPVHVFSRPCDIEAMETLAQKYNIKIIYDAAHAMCVDYKGKSLLDYGDISATSWHATKLFNTGEGGACTTPHKELYEKLKRIRFFGHNDAKDVIEDGFNGKMTEIHAALGLANLKYLTEVRANRKSIYDIYHSNLLDVDCISFQDFDPKSYNYSYMPILLDSEEQVLKIISALEKINVYPRRYFYPSLNLIKAVSPYSPMPVSEDISKRILCLPSAWKLEEELINQICSEIKNACV